MTRAAVYLRISQDPTGEQAGVTRQREDCLALVDAQGWELLEVYQDNDISASSGKVRPDYQRLLRDIRAGQVDAIVAWHPDRLYRKLANLEELIEAIEKQSVILRTVRAGEIDLSTPTGRMLARILSATAQAEGEVKADRWARSWRQGREAGKFAKTGSRLFGYTRDGQLIPHEADIARRMVKDHLAGVPLFQIATQLERDGILTTRGSVWRTGTLRQYLKSPRIAGLSTLKGEIVGEGDWEPIIDRDTWEELQAVLLARAKGRPPRVALLGGLVFCGLCGHRMITGSARGKRNYRCPKRPGMDGCAKVSAYAEPVEQIVEAFAKERLADPRITATLAGLRARPGANALAAEISAAEQRVAELEEQLDKPGVPVKRLLIAVDRLRDRVAEAQSELADTIRAGNATAAAEAYSGGLEWPTSLAKRRELVEIALGDRIVKIAPVERGKHNPFDPTRVRIEERD